MFADDATLYVCLDIVLKYSYNSDITVSTMMYFISLIL